MARHRFSGRPCKTAASAFRRHVCAVPHTTHNAPFFPLPAPNHARAQVQLCRWGKLLSGVKKRVEGRERERLGSDAFSERGRFWSCRLYSPSPAPAALSKRAGSCAGRRDSASCSVCSTDCFLDQRGIGIVLDEVTAL